MNSDPCPTVNGEEAVVEEKYSNLYEEHGEGIERGYQSTHLMELCWQASFTFCEY